MTVVAASAHSILATRSGRDGRTPWADDLAAANAAVADHYSIHSLQTDELHVSCIQT